MPIRPGLKAGRGRFASAVISGLSQDLHLLHADAVVVDRAGVSLSVRQVIEAAHRSITVRSLCASPAA
jgi:hypothetical protein